MQFSWDHIRSFQAVAETGSLSAASRKLGLTQPTLGRHIDLLEDTLKVPLFVRGRDGMRLTDKGADLIATAAEMTASALEFERRAAGLDEAVTGTVRISANEVFGVLLLPPQLADFQRQNPGIDVELVVDNAAANLNRRDADIAIRMFRPTQNDLIARKITDLPLGLFAHDRYLDRHGTPETLDDLKQHNVIGFDRDPSLIEAAGAMGLTVTAGDFSLRSDSILAQFNAIRAGAGIGVAHLGLAARWPQVHQVLAQAPLPDLPLWLACHADIRFNARVRLMMDFLAARLRTPYPTR